MISLEPRDLSIAAPWALAGGFAQAAVAVAAGLPAVAPVALVAGAAFMTGLVQNRRRPVIALVLLAPAIALVLWVSATGQPDGYWIAVGALAAGCLAGHPMILGLIVLTALPVFLVGWGIPPVYLVGWAYASLVARLARAPHVPASQ